MAYLCRGIEYNLYIKANYFLKFILLLILLIKFFKKNNTKISMVCNNLKELIKYLEIFTKTIFSNRLTSLSTLLN